MSTVSLRDQLASYSETFKPGDNDNGSSNELTNVNDNEKYIKRQRKSTAEIDNIADQLVECFANPGARRYYCKVAMQVSESTIWSSAEIAKRGRSPVRYFTWLCEKAMR